MLTKNATVSDHELEQADSRLGKVLLRVTDVRCANDSCLMLALTVALYENKGYEKYKGYKRGALLHHWNLLPDSRAKPQPDYIPLPIRDDYVEACKIRDLSPKSSATLARRCLQGMIRDFCGISKARLVDEIAELRRQVEVGVAPQGVMLDSVGAIDAVRKVGNIGAHMERDINVIVEIDPNEANILIGLVEMLFREWYVARRQRQDRLAELEKLAGIKAVAKTPTNARAAPLEAISAPAKPE